MLAGYLCIPELQNQPHLYLLYGVELDPSAAVPDTDEVIQSRADDARGGADQRGDIASVTVNMADAAPGQDIPQADGAVLPAARQNHRLRKPRHKNMVMKANPFFIQVQNLTLIYCELEEAVSLTWSMQMDVIPPE